MAHVVSVSSGLSSAIVLWRVLRRYGWRNVVAVFMDTLIEDPDNYRFLRQLVDFMQELFGPFEYVELRDGRDPYQVSQEAQIIPNQKIAPCTRILKIKLFTDWLDAEYNGQDVTVHIGYDYSEVHRIEATRRNYEAQGWQVDFPLIWDHEPIEFRDYTVVSRQDWGIEPPRMYGMGYTHANCGGRCVKQGLGDWKRTLLNFPELYTEAEEWEQQMRDHPVRMDYGLLRQQANGKVKALTLQAFRERVDNENPDQMSLDLMSPCVHCGVGDLLAE